MSNTRAPATKLSPSGISRCRAIAVITSTACSNFLVTFQFATFGMLYVVLTEYFDVSHLKAGWIGSIQTGVTYMIGLCTHTHARAGTRARARARGHMHAHI